MRASAKVKNSAEVVKKKGGSHKTPAIFARLQSAANGFEAVNQNRYSENSTTNQYDLCANGDDFNERNDWHFYALLAICS
jgi:hypothetical protein